MRRPRILLVRIIGDVTDFWLGIAYFVGVLIIATAAVVVPWP